ncbi:MAG: hypothetical protein IJG94_02055 [Clostridia bacterium]|nr:hypothetical protein [Clostridia bacterium]
MHLTIRQRHADFILELRKNLYDLPRIISSGRSGETENLSDIPLLTEEEIMGLKEFVGKPDSNEENYDEELAAEVEKKFRKLFG